MRRFLLRDEHGEISTHVRYGSALEQAENLAKITNRDITIIDRKTGMEHLVCRYWIPDDE